MCDLSLYSTYQMLTLATRALLSRSATGDRRRGHGAPAGVRDNDTDSNDTDNTETSDAAMSEAAVTPGPGEGHGPETGQGSGAAGAAASGSVSRLERTLEMGLRERKKQQTRETLSQVATSLFTERGFERATIADVAYAAGVSKMTVTNYFPLKEDLVFDKHEQITRRLVDAVTERPTGTSVLDAVRTAYLEALARRDPTLGFMGEGFAKMVEASPALRAREREIFDQQEDALAERLAEEAGGSAGDIRPRIVAAQLASVHRVLYHEGRRLLLSGESTDAIVDTLRATAETSFGLVERGLARADVTA